MRLSELLNGLSGVQRHGDAEIDGIQVDSRQVQPGDLFVALVGRQTDGHRHLDEALARGANALLVSDPCAVPSNASVWALVDDTREALWRIAQRFYGDPSRKMTVVGVTGTNGKTTTTHYLQQVFLAMGEPCLLVGTLGAWLATPDGGKTQLGGDIDFTTPEVFQIQAMLHEALERGARYAVMEVSSHALDQKRADGIRFSAGVFTNLTQDHLDYHGTMEAYARAKLRLFTELVEMGRPHPPIPSPNAVGEGERTPPAPEASREGGRGDEGTFRSIINLDTERGAWFAERAQGELWTYGTHPKARVRAVEVVHDADGIRFQVVSERGAFEVFTSLRAPYNLYNALGAVACALSLGAPVPAIQQGIARLSRVPGRFERVPIEAPFEVFVDFAHTPDALERVLQTARQLQPSRLTVVFGCGGDRDPLKRPKMGAIASQLADRVILTSDNPRTEDPLQILNQILEGIPASERARVVVEPDRKQAIAIALQETQPGEVILLAGKGHEEYQIIGTTRHPFSDRQVALQLMGVESE